MPLLSLLQKASNIIVKRSLLSKSNKRFYNASGHRRSDITSGDRGTSNASFGRDSFLKQRTKLLFIIFDPF